MPAYTQELSTFNPSVSYIKFLNDLFFITYHNEYVFYIGVKLGSLNLREHQRLTRKRKPLLYITQRDKVIRLRDGRSGVRIPA